VLLRRDDDPGYREVLRRVGAALAEAAAGRTAAVRVGGGDRVGREEHVGLRQGDPGRGDLGEAVAQPLHEGRHEAGVIEELAHLVDLDDTVEPGLGECSGVVLAILAAARVRAVGARADGDELREAALVGLDERLLDIGVPVAVAPQHREVDSPAGELGLEGRLEFAVLLVDGAHAAERAIVVGDGLEAFLGDAAPPRDVPEERDDIVLAFRSAEAREEDGVIIGGLGDMLGTGSGCGRRRTDELRDGRGVVLRGAHASTSGSSEVLMRRPV